MNKRQIAEILSELGMLLELKGNVLSRAFAPASPVEEHLETTEKPLTDAP